MLRKFIQQSWLVLVSSVVFGLLVAFVNGQLEDRIKLNAAEKLDAEMKLLLPDASTFEPVKNKEGISWYVGKDQTGRVLGYAFKAEGSGFADKISLLVAVNDSVEKLLGIAVLKSNETPGFGDKMKEESFRGQFHDCPIEQKLTVVKKGDRSKVDSEIVAITGATITSDAVVKIVNDTVEKMRPLIKDSK